MRASLADLVADCRTLGYVPEETDTYTVVDGILGLIWCVASGLAYASNDTVVNEIVHGVNLACRQWGPAYA